VILESSLTTMSLHMTKFNAANCDEYNAIFTKKRLLLESVST